MFKMNLHEIKNNWLLKFRGKLLEYNLQLIHVRGEGRGVGHRAGHILRPRDENLKRGLTPHKPSLSQCDKVHSYHGNESEILPSKQWWFWREEWSFWKDRWDLEEKEERETKKARQKVEVATPDATDPGVSAGTRNKELLLPSGAASKREKPVIKS